MRFYDVSSGKIFIDGKDIRDYDVGVLREKFGAVFQNDIIFEDSVSENIKLGRNITDENMKKAAKASCIDSHISQMDEGYDSFLAIRGNNLSGGQKQRMLISRAIAGNPEILVLDDSSSALDYKTDAAIRKNIDEMGKNTTTIIVAQRVSSVLDCDKIIVIDEGRIAACGNHDKLLKTCAIYARISSLQSGITQKGESVIMAKTGADMFRMGPKIAKGTSAEEIYKNSRSINKKGTILRLSKYLMNINISWQQRYFYQLRVMFLHLSDQSFQVRRLMQ